MRILVCGGRTFGNIYMENLSPQELFQKEKERNFIWDKLEQITGDYFNINIISGMADGVDTVAYEFARDTEISLLSFPADWKKHGKSAGPIRNQQMLDEGKPNLIVAFPGGTGTADMIRRAKKAEIEVKEVKYPE